MARPSKCRRICSEPEFDGFVPRGNYAQETVILSVDEYETIRLIDLERLTQEQCAAIMNISRPTVTEIYDAARSKLADCIVNGKALNISGGNYRLCDGSALPYCRRNCSRAVENPRVAVTEKGRNIMRIAVTYENGNVFQHFGHTEQFKLYDIENNCVISEQVVNTVGQGHGALAGLLQEIAADVLICGGIGGGAQSALAEAGIKLCGGVSGNADEAVQAYLRGNLDFDPNVHCSHNGHEHGHSCGEDKHGCGGNGGGCHE
ncbi:MAG: DUF134 domain-containing protein [Oscillospiraceae bacterium]